MKKRRYATKVEYRHDSTSHPDFKKYSVTVREIDGTEKVYPAYGYDASDVLSRLNLNLRLADKSKWWFTDNTITAAIWIVCLVIPMALYAYFFGASLGSGLVPMVVTGLTAIGLGTVATILYSKWVRYTEMGKRGKIEE